MAEKKFIFGVRARLALFITLLLAGVSGTQYVTNYRQQLNVVTKLVQLNHQINEAIRSVDTQLKDRTAPSPASAPGHRSFRSFDSISVTQEFEGFLDYVERNLPRSLNQNQAFREMLDRISELRRFASQAEASPGGDSFFRVTVSVMDEMSRRSPSWHYTISSSPLMPPADDILQISIPVVEEGQVRFVHMQYQISDFLADLDHSRKTSLLVTLATLGIGLIFALIFSGRFTRPIRTVNEAFSRVERGDLNCRIESTRKDELGQLVAGFNHMVERLKQNKELEKTIYRQERLSSLGKLAGGIAHEIKNPLNAINLSLQHLGDKLTFESREDRELFHRYSGNLQREVGRLSRIVDTFLNFSRVSELERSRINLHWLIDEVLTLLALDVHERGVRTETAFTEGGLMVNVDPEKMKTVFLNLVLNAIEAMPSGGKLRIQTAGGNGKPSQITVSDTGCGISRENLDHIFDLYFSTKEQGSGLGLAIVNNIIRDHGGEIAVCSSLGTGSDFTITLP